MSIEIALLGFLNQSPMTGYDLKARFDRTVAGFWPAPQSQIYTILHRLLDEDCVTVEVIPQEGRPNRRVYRITDLGQERLLTWVSGTPKPDRRRSRSPFLLQLWHGGLIEDEVVLEFLRRRVVSFRAMLDPLMEQVRHFNGQQEVGDRGDYFRLLTLDYGVRNMQFQIQWIEALIERIENKEYERGENAAIRYLLEGDTDSSA